MAGDITQPKRPRYESNERFDTVDANAASVAARLQLDAATKSLLSTPRNTVATPTGLIVTGFSLTPNPTAGNDGLVRINIETGVALDSNGRTIIKPNGSTIDVTIPIGTFQIYVYYVEVSTDNAKRRFLPAAPPFVEFTQAIDTAFQGGVNVFLRVGGIGLAVAEDVVNGATTSLCLIGVATNAGAGAITITGHNPVTAPNGTDITNRLSTVLAPAVVPTTNTRNGSMQTLHDLITAALYTVGQTAWLGSDFLVPSAANNFGAYSAPAGGADKAFRQALGWVTIGNGTTVKGDFNTSDYPDSNALLVAAFASLPASGGVIVLKRGVQLTNFAGVSCPFPAKSVEIIGDHTTVPSTLPHITFGATEGFTCSGGGSVILRNLHIRFESTAVQLTTSPFKAFNIYMENVSNGGGPAFNGINVSDLTLEDIYLTTVLTAASASGQLLQITSQAHRVRTNRLRYSPGDTSVFNHGRTIYIGDVRSDVSLEDTTYEPTVLGAGGGGSVVFIDSTDNTTVGEFENRIIKGLYLRGDAGIPLLFIGDGLSQLTAEDVSNFESTHSAGLIFSNSTYVGGGQMNFRRLYTGNNSNGMFIGAAQSNILVEDSRFFGLIHQWGSSSAGVGRVIIRGCHFQRGTLFNIQGNQVTGAFIDNVIIEDCHFENSGNILITATVGACIQVTTTGTIESVAFKNNRINHTHFGDNYTNANIPNLFAVRANYVGSVLCQDNEAYHVLGFTLGGAKRAPFLLKTMSGNGTTNATIQWRQVIVQDNTIGAESYCTLFALNAIVPQQITIKGNTFDTTWDTTVGVPLLSDMMQIIYGTNFTLSRTLSIHDNEWFYRNPGSTTITEELLAYTAISVFLGDFSFMNNNIAMDTPAAAFSTGMLFTLPVGGIVTMAIWDNIANRNSPFVSSWLQTSFSTAPVRSFPSLIGWFPPGAGSPWPNNDHIHNT
jgi:hypothetical protein